MQMHDYTYGITSDPLTQFAIVYSALIHDCDHEGVSNGQLIKEQSKKAIYYEGKSVAEQNSVDLAWSFLMEPQFSDLQKCIYASESELKRFRQLVVNSVIATDIFDPGLKEFRNRRWDAAFHHGIDDANLRATIVIEHIVSV
jgi:3'5'-cyclic nucleotide phosphodiesterase